MLAISPKPVIIILMKIEKDFEENENDLDAESAMDVSMDMIMQLAIEPAMENDLIDEEGAKVLGTVAQVLRIIAEKAQAYEKLRDCGNEYSRN